jgi:hypothetical protein
MVLVGVASEESYEKVDGVDPVSSHSIRLFVEELHEVV